MATEREWLASQGLALLTNPDTGKPARGKFSRDAQAALVKAKAEGMTFDLPAYKQAQVDKAKAAAEPKVAPTVTSEPVVVTAPSPVATPATVAAMLPKAPRVKVEPETVRPRPSTETLRADAKAHGRLWASHGNQIVGFQTCFNSNCRRSVIDCQCEDGPAGPVGYAVVSAKEAFV